MSHKFFHTNFISLLNFNVDSDQNSNRKLPIPVELNKLISISNGLSRSAGGPKKSTVQSDTETKVKILDSTRVFTASFDNVSSSKANLEQHSSKHFKSSPDQHFRILRLPEVQKRVSLSRSTIYNLIASGQFPQRVSLGARAMGFFEHEIDAWIKQLARGV